MFPALAPSSPSPHLLYSNYLEYIHWPIKMSALFCLHIFAHAIPSTWNVLPTLSLTGKTFQDPNQMSPPVIPPLATPEKNHCCFSSAPIVRLGSCWEISLITSLKVNYHISSILRQTFLFMSGIRCTLPLIASYKWQYFFSFFLGDTQNNGVLDLMKYTSSFFISVHSGMTLRHHTTLYSSFTCLCLFPCVRP